MSPVYSGNSSAIGSASVRAGTRGTRHHRARAPARQRHLRRQKIEKAHMRPLGRPLSSACAIGQTSASATALANPAATACIGCISVGGCQRVCRATRAAAWGAARMSRLRSRADRPPPSRSCQCDADGRRAPVDACDEVGRRGRKLRVVAVHVDVPVGHPGDPRIGHHDGSGGGCVEVYSTVGAGHDGRHEAGSASRWQVAVRRCCDDRASDGVEADPADCGRGLVARSR